jgi:hypothetical protein
LAIAMLAVPAWEAGATAGGPGVGLGVAGIDVPVAFEPNRGQTAPQVRFFGRAAGYQLFIESDESVIALDGVRNPRRAGKRSTLEPVAAAEPPRAIRIELLGADPSQKIDASDPLPGCVNYLLGNDPTGWHAGIPTYRTVTQHDAWPGIDLVYHPGPDGGIESDFVVAAGADPRRIRFRLTGGDGVSLDRDGNLLIAAGRRSLTLLKPRVYQHFGRHRLALEGQYVIEAANAAGGDGVHVRFEIASYDRRRMLVIDPQVALDYSTYLGGSGLDGARAIAVDDAGEAFVAGYTKSPDFPGVQGQLQDSEDAFVAKLSADGQSLVYASFIGGTGGSGVTDAYAIAVTSDGNAFITGVTDAKNFPTTKRAYQRDAPKGGHPFVSELAKNGRSFVFSTYVASSDTHKCSSSDPGVDWGTGIAVNPNAEPYVTGITCSTHFPDWVAIQIPIHYTSPTSYYGDQIDFPAAFVLQLDRDGHKLYFSTYLGGNGFTKSNAIAVDPNLVVPGIYVTGETSARSFPTKHAFQAHRHGYSDVFITKLSTDGKSIVYSTFLGGDNGDEGRGIAVDRQGHAYVIGNYASMNFPITNLLNLHEEPIPGIFVAKLSHGGDSLLFCDSLAGSFATQSGNGIAVAHDFAYVTGTTNARDFPVVNAFQNLPQGGRDAFVSKISQDGHSLVWSTYLGGNLDEEGNGIAVAPDGTAFVTGRTTSGNFPTHDPVQPQLSAQSSAFIARLEMTQ